MWTNITPSSPWNRHIGIKFGTEHVSREISKHCLAVALAYVQRNIEKNFQLAITTSWLKFIDYDTATAQRWRIYQLLKHVIWQKIASLCRKRVSMLTGFKVSPLARKCLSYRPELIRVELNFERLAIQKWNILTDRNQRAMTKMGSFASLSCLFSELWSLKCQKWLNFLYSLLMTAKNQLQFAQII